MNKSSGVELLVVGALALIALLALTFVGLTVMWNRPGDITPLVSIASVGVGALASLLVKLQGSVDVPATLEEPVQLRAISQPAISQPSTPIPSVPAGTGG